MCTGRCNYGNTNAASVRVAGTYVYVLGVVTNVRKCIPTPCFPCEIALQDDPPADAAPADDEAARDAAAQAKLEVTGSSMDPQCRGYHASLVPNSFLEGWSESS